LQAALDQPDVAMRYRAARALQAIDPASADGVGKAGEQDVASLLAALKGGDPQGRRHAGQMLGNLGPAAVATLPQLADDLAAASPADRQQLAATMHEITESALGEVPELIAELKAGGAGAERAAAALGAFGNDARLAKHDLIEALDDPDPEVRLTVAEVLGDISDYSSRVIGALTIEALDDDQPALAALQQHTS
jgi:HEAT repeat protein